MELILQSMVVIGYCLHLQLIQLYLLQDKNLLEKYLVMKVLFYRDRPLRPDVHRLVDRREAALGEHGADVYATIVQADAPREGPGPLCAEPVPESSEPGEHGAPEAVEGGAAAARQRCC